MNATSSHFGSRTLVQTIFCSRGSGGHTFLVLVKTLLHAAQRMERCSLEWVHGQSPTMAVGSRSPSESRKADQHQNASLKGGFNTQDSTARWGCGGEEGFAVGFGKGPETSRGVPVGAPDPGHEGFCKQGEETDARSGREDHVGSGGIARSDGRERLRHSRTPLGRSTFGTAPGPALAALDLEAEVQRLRALLKLAEMQAAQTPIRPPQSSVLSADLLIQTSSKIHRDDSYRSTGSEQMDGRQTLGVPGCDRIQRSGVDSLSLRFNSFLCDDSFSLFAKKVVNPTMVDLTVLDSASEVDDHVVPRHVLGIRDREFAINRNDVLREERAWKLFFLLPRMLLARPLRGGKISPVQLEERIARFTEGRCRGLRSLQDSCCEEAQAPHRSGPESCSG